MPPPSSGLASKLRSTTPFHTRALRVSLGLQLVGERAVVAGLDGIEPDGQPKIPPEVSAVGQNWKDAKSDRCHDCERTDGCS